MLPANINHYNPNDTIIAVSSGTASCAKQIVRISGDKTFDIIESLTGNKLPREKKIVSSEICLAAAVNGGQPRHSNGGANHDKYESFSSGAKLYLFPSPHSYTGDDLAEIHIFACDEVTEKLFSKLVSLGCRTAEAGEFTYRAYINGKMDLSQAEAVSQIISSSNQYQLSAAQRLFGGVIEKKVAQIRGEILELLGLIEAGLDFGTEDIEIITTKKAQETAEKICNNLNELLAGSITFEQILDAPSVVIAGSANAGKSSLVNAIIGEKRSIVSDQSGTTRDCLQHWLKLDKCDCILFDCAGLVIKPADIIQSLANVAALKAVEDSTIIIFCADITKKDYSADLEILKRFSKKPSVYIAAKCDLLPAGDVAGKLENFKNIFGCDFLATSAEKLFGIEELKELIQQKIVSQIFAKTETAEKTALMERHKQAITEAIKNIQIADVESGQNNEEAAAMFLRLALENLSSFEARHIDDVILDIIFSKFCIGK